jgi:metal-sulfur cluster biosynthetic enzyme
MRRLDAVYDPELDESIVRLGFIDDLQIDGVAVTVTYKLPTYWCAPNFAYMMSADIRAQVAQVPGVESVQVVLRDHCDSAAINAGVNAGSAFREAFPQEALDDLDELRRTFLRKSFLARQEQLLRRLRTAGLDDARILALRCGELQPRGDDLYLGAVRVRLAAGDMEKYLRKRAALGLPCGEDALLFTTLEGAPLELATLADYLRRSRTVRVSLAFNTSLCEGLLRTRYQPERVNQHTSLGDQLLDIPTVKQWC